MNKSLKILTASFALLVLLGCGLAGSASAQVAITAADSKAIVKAMDAAMEPGDQQKRLDFMVGTFDVKVKVWINPGEPSIESTATAVASWVLGHRYIQQMLSGYIMGEAWSGIGYAGFDNKSSCHSSVTWLPSGDMVSLISSLVGLRVIASAMVAVSFADLPSGSMLPVYHSMPVLPVSI